MVEDEGVAAPRIALASLLKVQERTVPTECVHYSLPHDKWISVKMEDDFGGFASLKVDTSSGRYKLFRDGVESDVTAPLLPSSSSQSAAGLPQQPQMQNEEDEQEIHTHYYLNGRITVKARPLSMFERPGVLLKVHQRVDNNDDDGRGTNDSRGTSSTTIVMGVVQVVAFFPSFLC